MSADCSPLSLLLRMTDDTQPQQPSWVTTPSLNTTFSDIPTGFLIDYYSCSGWGVVVATLSFSLTIALLTHLIAWYKFLAAWNQIARAAYEIPQLKRSYSWVDLQDVGAQQCPICLSDFSENQAVTACDESCGQWFHKECLFEWLEGSDACPCCRHNLMAPPSSCWSSYFSSSSTLE